MRWWIFGLLMLLSGLPGTAECAERRVALIIGNDAYVKINPLRNAGNDARKMEQALKAAGFETTLRVDAKRRTLYQVIDAFAAQIAASQDTVGLFYYAGHGIQANGSNYLIPVDADIESDADLEAEAVDANKVLHAMADAHNRLNIVVLDACRDNPLPKGRSASRGLARMEAPTGTFIAYAAGPGQTAQDGAAGGNGVFTGELVKAMAVPGLPIEQVFKMTLAGVRNQTGQKQVPWTEASIQGDFYFHSPVTSNVTPAARIAPAPAPVAPAAPATDAGAFELAYWNSVKDAKNAAEIKSYLDRYPKGTFAGIAKVKYDELQAPTPAQAATPMSQGPHGWLGVMVQTITAEQAEGAGLDPKHPAGGIAMQLADGGPAARAGIQYGDVIVRFDGKAINQAADLQRAAADTPPGRAVDVGIMRKGAQSTLRLTVGTPPSGASAPAAASAYAPQAAPVSLPSRPPSGFANELTDFGVPAQSTLQFNVGSATPTTIPGGHVITTEALTHLTRSAILIDAWNDQGHSTLPGAIRMPAAGTPGNYFDQIQSGFREALAYRTNNNPQQTLVFFCASAECWESYNAALRALRLGYREVYWYRGGVTSWEAAGLPLNPP